MKKSLFILAAASALTLWSCVEDKDVTQRDDFVEAELSLSKATASVSEVGTSDVITFTSDQTVVDVVVDYAYRTWLAASVSGSQITVSAIADNPSLDPRTGLVSVTVGEKGVTARAVITVEQEGADPSKIPTFSIDKSTLSFTAAAGQSDVVTVTTNQDGLKAEVDASASAWLGATVDADKVTISTLTANTGSSREGKVTISAGDMSEVVTVLQAAGEGTIEVGAIYGGGIIVALSETQITIMSVDEFQGQFSTVSEKIGATQNTDEGEANTALIWALASYSSDTYPYAYWVKQKGEGWYIPSRADMVVVANTLWGDDAVETRLVAAGGTKLSDVYYWTSNEHSSDSAKQFAVKLSNKNAAGYAKTGNRYGRAFKHIAR